MDTESDLLLKGLGHLAVLILTFFLGRISTKTQFQRERNHEKLERLIESLRVLTEVAHRYFTEEMSARERHGLEAIIHTKMRRLSIDLNDYSLCVKCKSKKPYLDSYSQYHAIVTDEPFGDETFNLEEIDQSRIEEIATIELRLVSAIRAMLASD